MEYKQSEVQSLYPQLPKVEEDLQPSAPAQSQAHIYRLQKIGEIQKELEAEKDKRATLSKNIIAL